MLEEGDRFASLFVEFLETDRSKACWYKIIKSAELAFPRAYLLLTLGAVYLRMDEATFQRHFHCCERIKTREALIEDMRVSCLSVGEPVKGLALHASLLRQLEGFLYREEEEGWCLGQQATKDLLLNEFIATNRLWVRMRFVYGDGYEMLRHQVGDIVAYPVKLMSQIPGLQLESYKEDLLPVLLQHLIGCRDSMVQEALTEVILSSFSVQFHLETAVLLLDAVSQYNMTIDIRRIIGAIISKILYTREEDECMDVYDVLWEKIEGLLLQRIETSRTDEAVLLCTPLLNHALGMRPFASDRVEKILQFICLCARQASAYPDQSTNVPLLIGKAIDIVLEFAPNARSLFEFPSLIDLLNESKSSSCALSFLGRLTKDNLRIEGEYEIKVLSEVLLQITTMDTPDDLVNNVNVLEYAADSVYNGILIIDDTNKLVANGKVILSQAYDTERVLAMLIFTLKAINSWLVSGCNMDVIRSTLKDFRKLTSGKQVIPAISRPQFDKSPIECQRQLSFYTYDSVPLHLVQLWGRCLEMWRVKDVASDDLVYDVLVEMLVIFEEDVTDHHPQCQVLTIIATQLEASASKLKKNDVSVLVSKLHSYGRRLIKLEERRRMLLQILQLCSKLGGQVDVDVVISIAETMKGLLPTLNVETIDDLVEFCKHLIAFLTVTEPQPVIFVIHINIIVDFGENHLWVPVRD